MAHFHAPDAVEQALDLLRGGLTISATAHQTGVPRKTVQYWKKVYIVEGRPRGQAHCQVPCPRCDRSPLDGPAYAELLGWYLGDGHIARGRGDIKVLRIYNDDQYVEDNARLLDLFKRVKPNSRPHAHKRPDSHMIITAASWKHWPCLFPQHGPGYKHTRPITLEPWQAAIVHAHPGPFLRGLFHSDGARVNNWATRTVAGVRKRYDYPRWQFSNRSADIRGLCCWALDLVDVEWRHSQTWTISVSKREAVARLDELIGPKS